MITEAQKQKILAAIAANRANYPSDAKHAASLAISTSEIGRASCRERV